MSDDLVTWLRAEIEARRRTASALVLESGEPWRLDGGAWDAGTGILSGSGRPVAVAIGDYAARHIAASDPCDAIARCDAELAILDEHQPYRCGNPEGLLCRRCASDDAYPNGVAIHEAFPCRTVRLVGSGYQHRPGYRAEEWKP